MGATANPSLPLPPAWQLALQSRSFRPAGKAFQREGMIARPEGNWLVLEAAAPPQRSRSQQPGLEQCGLWKQVRAGLDHRYLFEIPISALACDAENGEVDERAVPLPEALLDWALASARSEIPAGWQPPARELVSSWMPQEAMTVRIGPLLRQGELLLAPDRWAVRLPVVPCRLAELPRERRRALRLLASDAQSQWRMVRLGFCGNGDNPGLTAVLDLTGAPHSERLFLAGLNGLAHCVAWLAETADLLADVTLTLRSLEVHRLETEKRERKHHDRHHPNSGRTAPAAT